MSVYNPSQVELQREQRLVNDPYWQSERETLHDLLTRLASAAGDEEFFRVHVLLVARLKARQERISELRETIATLAACRRELASIDPKPVDDLRSVQRELEAVHWEATVQRALHWLLLDVGDALVWRRLGFDRAAITALGQGQRVAWLSSGSGWEAEVAAVNELWEGGTLAVINDATTCLRLGDLTCFFDDRVEIREVKAGKVAADDHPQQIRLREAITLINEGRARVSGNRRAVVRCSEPLETYLGVLPRLLKRARQSGRAVAAVSRSQLVLARDFSHPTQEPFDEAEAREVAGWPADDVVLDWGSSLRRMRDRHYNSSYLAPLALLPLKVDDKVDLLLGQLDFSVWVNVSSVASFLRGRGFRAEPIVPPESARWFLRAGRRRRNTLSTVHVTAHVREMMAIELVTPSYVAKLTDTLLSSLDILPELVDEQALVAPGDESATWAR